MVGTLLSAMKDYSTANKAIPVKYFGISGSKRSHKTNSDDLIDELPVEK